MIWNERVKAYSKLKPYITKDIDEQGFIELAKQSGDTLFHEELVVEQIWSQCRRPFYNVWPHVRDGLRRVPLAIPCEHVFKASDSMPIAISVRFPVGEELSTGGVSIKEFIAMKMMVRHNGSASPGFNVLCDHGESKPRVPGLDHLPDLPSQLIMTFPLPSEMTIEDAINSLKYNGLHGGLELSHGESEALLECIRVLCGIALMAHDPSLVEPIVIKADEAKYRETGDRKYVEKAIRRGVFGFNVGANIEVSPHYRRAHFALRWTGKGRETPKIVPVKGCVVRRQSVTDVPTGYLDDLVEV